MKNVAILLSTYNGSEHLEEQIISIMNQTYSNWKLYIRDDGSTDNTVEIITKWCTLDDRIFFINHDRITNLGVQLSFFELLKHVQSDFYMFCDQDDFWLENKVELSIEATSLTNSSLPCAIHTDLLVVDSKLNIINESMMNYQKLRKKSLFSHLLVQNTVTGCTLLINSKMKEILNIEAIKTEKILMHDWWIGLVASNYNNLVYIDEPTIMYRQHGKNTVGFKSYKSQLISKDKLVSSTISLAKTIEQAKYFFILYDEILLDNNRKISKLFSNILNYSTLKRTKILLENKILKYGFLRNLAMIMIFSFKNKEIKKYLGESYVKE